MKGRNWKKYLKSLSMNIQAVVVVGDNPRHTFFSNYNNTLQILLNNIVYDMLSPAEMVSRVSVPFPDILLG